MSEVFIDPESREVSRIVQSDQFQKLSKLRNKIRFTLSALTIASHAFFVGGIAFYSAWFAEPISKSSSIPKGILYAVLVILFMLFLELVYIYLDKKTISPLQRKANNEEITSD